MKVFDQVGGWHKIERLLETIQKHSRNSLFHGRTKYLIEIPPVLVEKRVGSVLQILVASKQILQLDVELFDFAETNLNTLHIRKNAFGRCARLHRHFQINQSIFYSKTQVSYDSERWRVDLLTSFKVASSMPIKI